MSATIRQTLSDAASALPAVNCTPHYRQATKPGEAMVRLSRVAYPEFGAMATWQVLVVLHQDVSTAEKWIDNNLAALVDVLAAEMTVVSAEPQELVYPDAARIPCVVITGTREQE